MMIMDSAGELYVEKCKSNSKEESLKRAIMYSVLLKDVKRRPVTIWDRESNFERRI